MSSMHKIQIVGPMRHVQVACALRFWDGVHCLPRAGHWVHVDNQRTSQSVRSISSLMKIRATNERLLQLCVVMILFFGIWLDIPNSR